MSTGFGARPDGGAFHYRQEQDIQALKLRLHRYIIDEIDEDGMNLLEGARSAVVQYVSEKVCEYGSRHQLAISRYELDRLAEEVVDELTGFGPLEILLRDPGVSEILVNGPGRVFVEREGRLYQSDLRFIDDHHVLRVIQRILAPLGRRLDESSPMVDARLPDGSRVNAIIPPVALDGPCISIRKFSQELLRSADLLAYQSVDEALLEFLRQAVSRRCNILISGGTGTGKTTLLNVISGFIDERERIVTIEDTAELQLGHDHVVRLETRPPNAEGYGEVTARDLIRSAACWLSPRWLWRSWAGAPGATNWWLNGCWDARRRSRCGRAAVTGWLARCVAPVSSARARGCSGRQCSRCCWSGADCACSASSVR